MYKVFFNDKFIILTDEHIFEDLEDGVLYVQYDDFEEIHYLLELLENAPNLKGIVLQYENLGVLWADFRAHFKDIFAGGGVVRNSQGDWLFIYRNGKWDLPKGKLEEGETPSEGALREVEEECGITDLVLGREIIKTYHTYPLKGFRILKTTWWFEMKSDQKSFIAQEDEGISKVEWLTQEGAVSSDLDTFPNIRLLIETTKATSDQP